MAIFHWALKLDCIILTFSYLYFRERSDTSLVGLGGVLVKVKTYTFWSVSYFAVSLEGLDAHLEFESLQRKGNILAIGLTCDEDFLWVKECSHGARHFQIKRANMVFNHSEAVAIGRAWERVLHD